MYRASYYTENQKAFTAPLTFKRPLNNRRFCFLARKIVFENWRILKYLKITESDFTQSRKQKGY